MELLHKLNSLATAGVVVAATAVTTVEAKAEVIAPPIMAVFNADDEYIGTVLSASTRFNISTAAFTVVRPTDDPDMPHVVFTVIMGEAPDHYSGRYAEGLYAFLQQQFYFPYPRTGCAGYLQGYTEYVYQHAQSNHIDGLAHGVINSENGELALYALNGIVEGYTSVDYSRHPSGTCSINPSNSQYAGMAEFRFHDTLPMPPYHIKLVDGGAGGAGIPGPMGPKGDTGPQGPTGNAGADGINGADGSDGAAGADGINGSDGTDGADGPMGPAGPQGPTGATGGDGHTHGNSATKPPKNKKPKRAKRVKRNRAKPPVVVKRYPDFEGY